MSQQDASSSAELLTSLRLIRSADPDDRMRGIEGLRALSTDPRVLQVFEHLYEKDPDPRVRDAAWRAINSAGPSIPAPGPAPAPPQGENGSRADAAPAPETRVDPAAAVAAEAPASAPPAPESKPAPAPSKPAPAPPRQSRRTLFLLKQANAPLVARYLRRPAKRNPLIGRAILGIAAVLLVVIGVLAGLVLPDWSDWWQLRREGVTVQGEIIGLQTRGDKLTALYLFTTDGSDGKIFTGEQRVTDSARDRLVEDAPVQVRYLPDDPDLSHLEDEPNPADTRRNSLTIAAGLLVVGLGALLAFGQVQTRQDRRGERVLKGQVVACSGFHDDDGDFYLKLRYRFRAPSGRVITGQLSQLRNDLRESDLPETGAPLAIYYRNERAYRVL